MLLQKRSLCVVCAAIIATLTVTIDAVAQPADGEIVLRKYRSEGERHEEQLKQVAKLFDDFATEQRNHIRLKGMKPTDFRIIAKDYRGKTLSDYCLVLMVHVSPRVFFFELNLGVGGMFSVPAVPLTPGTEVMISIDMFLTRAHAYDQFLRLQYDNFLTLSGGAFVTVGAGGTISLEVTQAQDNENERIESKDKKNTDKGVNGGLAVGKEPLKVELGSNDKSGSESSQTIERTHPVARPSKTLLVKQR